MSTDGVGDSALHCETTEGCITCGDVAVPLTVLEVKDADAWCCDEQGRAETVAVDFVPDARRGDLLLVHAGVALERLQYAGNGR